MLHIILHIAVPALVAVAFYRPRWRRAALLLLATMAIDLDHVLASPIYDPERCSIGFHPLHTPVAIGLYAVLFGLPLIPSRSGSVLEGPPSIRSLHLIGLGLLIHMALDWGDCVL